MPRRLNELVVRELKETFGGVDTCFFMDFTGLSGRKASDLRRQLRTACGDQTALTIVKASLAKRALAELPALSGPTAPLEDYLEGPTAVAFGADDPVLLARTLADWSRKQNLLRFKGGVLAGRPLPAGAVAELARIPPKPILMGLVVATIAAPLTSLLGVAQAVIRQAIRLADVLAEQKAQPQTE